MLERAEYKNGPPSAEFVLALAQDRDHWKQQYADAKATIADLQSKADLWRDEFQRIAALTTDGEILGICDRAKKEIERHVPMTVEVEQLQQQVADLQGQVKDVQEGLSLCEHELGSVRIDRAILQQRVAQLEGERDALKRDQVAAHACAKTFEQMSDESSLRRLLTTLQADHARVLELVQEANYELAALFPMPDNPTFEDAFVVCGNKNPADARCVLNAYEAIHQAASLPAQPVQGGAGTGLYDSPGHDIPGATCL